MWHPAIAAGHNHNPRGNRAIGSLHTPLAVLTVDPRGLNAEPWLQSVVRCVLLEISHELVTRHPAAIFTRNAVTRKVRQPPNGVQVQAVVAGPPGLPHTLAALQNGGVYAMRS
jgi:hypothetical protein